MMQRTCSRCDNQATRFQGHQYLCSMHYRFTQMRASAKRNGKTVPSHTELHAMVRHGNKCGDCAVLMNWHAADGKSTVACLQHYRDGTHGIVCKSCNTRHGKMPGDSFRTLPEGHKHCPKCKVIKRAEWFNADNARDKTTKLKSWCKTCSWAYDLNYRTTNRDVINAKQRLRRANIQRGLMIEAGEHKE